MRNREDAEAVQRDIDALHQWSVKWLLQFHPDKCKVITFGPHDRIPIALYYSLNEVVLEHSEYEKDMGIVIDEKLRFEDHILGRVKKANSMMTALIRVYTALNITTFKYLSMAKTIWLPICKA